MDAKLNLKIKIVNKIEEIPQDQWDSVFPKALENYHFFRTLDESSFEQFSFRYIFVYDNDTPIGAATCFIMDFPLDISVTGPLKSFINVVKKIFPGLINPKVVVCGLPMGPGRIGMTKAPTEVMEAVNSGLEEIAGEIKAPLIFFKDFAAEYDDTLKALLRDGFTRLESLPNTEMEINFKDFDGYLKTLSSSSREGLKRNFKKVDSKIKFDLEIVDKLEGEVLSQAYELYLQTYNNHELGFEKLPLEFFKNLSKNMPKEIKYFLWRVEGKLVTFALCLVSGDYFIDYYLGFDYTVSNQYYLYFIRFRDLLKWCIDHGIKRYEMGQTSYEPKRRLRFNFIRYYLYIKHRNPLLNFLLIPISHLMKPENFDPVFKQMNRKD